LYENLQNKILLHFDCQKGIKELFEKVLGKERIIYVNRISNSYNGIVVKCNNFIVVENKFHSLVPYCIMDKILPSIINNSLEKKQLYIALIKSNTTLLLKK
jgi:hypothetical protein